MLDTAAGLETMITHPESDIMMEMDTMIPAANEGIRDASSKRVCWVGTFDSSAFSPFFVRGKHSPAARSMYILLCSLSA